MIFELCFKGLYIYKIINSHIFFTFTVLFFIFKPLIHLESSYFDKWKTYHYIPIFK